MRSTSNGIKRRTFTREEYWHRPQNSNFVKQRKISIEESDMFCWGNTVNGELGLGGIEEEQILAPRELTFNKATEIEDVGCGQNHTVLVTTKGEVYSCGSNDHGQLGHDKSCKKPERVDSLQPHVITRVSCGTHHSLAVSEWGQLFSWGSDSHGQLGNGREANGSIQVVPKMVKTLATTQIVQISCGQHHCIALTKNGELYSWGANDYGQLGLGTATFLEQKPCLIQSLKGLPIAFIACGSNHSFVVSKSGAVYGWGKNAFGQLGHNDDRNKLYPNQLKTLRSVKVKYISCGEDFSIFLTKDGGVFSCGAGMYGQLGHGSTSNEFLPRKVLELMGSIVTQISCGRRHTLAFVPSRGRVYAFGLGGAGQLGTRVALSAATPQVVLGPWVSPGGASVIDADVESEHSINCVVKHIYSGGDHCFATVTHLEDKIPPDDFRVFKPSTQILCLTVEKGQQMEKASPDERLDPDLLTYVETAFSSVACINSSFLLANDEHYCCNSRNPGIDLSAVEEFFRSVSRVENTSIKELITTCISENLLPSLSASPPDVETLRVYVTLMCYHEFDNPKNHLTLHNPLANSFLGLKLEAATIVGKWWIAAPVDFFERLIRIFKSVVSFIIMKAAETNPESVTWDENLLPPLEMLLRLHKLNREVDGLKVPYESFYLSELTEKVDLRSDYFRWLMIRDPMLLHVSRPGWMSQNMFFSNLAFNSKKQRIYFCNYPFLFDAKAKTLLLQADQALQMQTAMSEAASRAITGLILSPSRAATINTFLYFEVSREHLVEDTLRELARYEAKDLKRPLKVKFVGEEAEDAGGVTKEFFLLLIKEILDPKYGMFRQYEETNAVWFNEASFEEDVMYYLIGVLCGLAIYNFTIIALPFPLALYKKLLNEPVSLQDLKGLSPTLAKSLQDLLDYTEPDMEEVFSLNFEITKEIFGELKVVPLKPGGESIPVTQENKKEYVDLYVDMVLNKSVEKQFKAFSSGFHKVCGGRVLELFQAHELMEVVVGNENYNWDVLERNAEYRNGFTANDITIRLFWEVFHELSLEDKKKFLLFLTGTDRIPLQGMEAIKIYIQPVSDDRFLPVAHTCFNLLDLPRYKTKEKLRYKLLQAIQQTQGFSLV